MLPASLRYVSVVAVSLLTLNAAHAAPPSFVNDVVPADRLHEEALTLARKIGEASPAVVGIGKSAFYQQVEMPQGAAYGYAKDVMTANAQVPDAQEGIGAFIERRKPVWRQ